MGIVHIGYIWECLLLSLAEISKLGSVVCKE